TRGEDQYHSGRQSFLFSSCLLRALRVSVVSLILSFDERYTSRQGLGEGPGEGLDGLGVGRAVGPADGVALEEDRVDQADVRGDDHPVGPLRLDQLDLGAILL